MYKMNKMKKAKAISEGLFCNYSQRLCMQNRLENYEYCIRHILEDKNAPYKQCNYVYPKNGKRCTSAASKLEKKDGYCPEHCRRVQLLRQKTMRKRKFVETPETLLEDLDHYTVEESKEISASGTGDPVDSKQEPPPTLGQWKQAVHVHHSMNKALANSVTLDWEYESDSEKEAPLIENCWKGDEDSDAESIDSEHEDLLKHAGVYTNEEVALIFRDKLFRLQLLYTEQFKRLHHVMKESRRRYLHSVKSEKETLGSIHSTPQNTTEEKQLYKKLKWLNRYHKYHGKELLLRNQQRERQLAAAQGLTFKDPAYPRCVQSTDTDHCDERTLPLSKYCMKHILHDSHQVLFRPCVGADSTCKRPVVPFNETTCILHHTLPSLPHLLNMPSDTNTCIKEDENQVDLESTLLQSVLTDQTTTESMPHDMDEGNYSIYPDIHHEQEICHEILQDMELPAEIFSILPSDFLSGNQPSPETDVEK